MLFWLYWPLPNYRETNEKKLPHLVFYYVSIGKERLFLEVARSLRKKVYVTAAKLRLLNCLEFTEEDMQWFTSNEHESNIHVAPMWTLASFKRLKHISSQYAVSVCCCLFLSKPLYVSSLAFLNVDNEHILK